ncbi:MAG: glycoside hydrolase family 31 protein, partial [Candidatus Lokiarchaeota archaeon]
EYQKHGIPPMRGCFLHYENDKELYNLKYQFMLGKDLIVAPVIKPKTNIWKVYLPNDSWVHLLSGKTFKSGWNDVNAPIGKPPVFYRNESKFKGLFSELTEIKD